jgi:hypothetical protein
METGQVFPPVSTLFAGKALLLLVVFCGFIAVTMLQTRPSLVPMVGIGNGTRLKTVDQTVSHRLFNQHYSLLLRKIGFEQVAGPGHCCPVHPEKRHQIMIVL